MIRKVLIVAFVIAVFAIVGQVLWINMHPRGGILMFSEAGEPSVMGLDRGVHQVEGFTVEVRSEDDFFLLPASGTQCFVQLRLTSLDLTQATIAERIEATGPVSISRATYTTLAEVPQAVERDNPALLLRPIDCTLMSAPKAEIVAALQVD